MLNQLMTRELETEASHIEGANEPHAAIEQVVDALVNRAAAAQRTFEGWSEERVDRLFRRLAHVVAENAHWLAAVTVAETGMGNVRDKAHKNTAASLGVITAEADLRHAARSIVQSKSFDNGLICGTGR